MKYKKLFLLLTICATLCHLLPPRLSAQPTIYLVRHAEKLANWPGGPLGSLQPLSREGIARTERLAEFFSDKNLKAVYTSPTTRCAHTAFTISQHLNLPMQAAKACMDTTAISSFYGQLTEEYNEDDIVLLVSHSNMIPYLLMKAGLPQDCETEMGFTTSPQHAWIVIEGYDHVWKIDRSDKNGQCGGVYRMKTD